MVEQQPTRIRVAVRVRPLMSHENAHSEKIVADISRSVINVYDNPENIQQRRDFQFDQVFEPISKQQEVYNGLGIPGMIKKVVEGYHATIFAYGQTGSGKTYTMEGMGGNAADQHQNVRSPNREEARIGISQKAIMDLFKQVKRTQEQQGKIINVFCSFLQIYNERVFDLLNPESTPNALEEIEQRDGRIKTIQPQGLRIRWTKKEQFVVENLFVFECTQMEDALELFHLGLRNKVVAAHNLNHQSSRSHCIFTITVETVDPQQLDTTITSKLQLVDLAGSEKIQPTSTTMAKESIDINKSLFVLRKVINRLSEISSEHTNNGSGQKQNGQDMKHVPYRDSKLTSLLKHSLGGNSFCLMIACISPAEKYLPESISTLNYATRAANICNQPQKNIDPKMKIIASLQQKVEALQNELRQANEHIDYLTQLVEQNQQINTQKNASVSIPTNELLTNRSQVLTTSNNKPTPRISFKEDLLQNAATSPMQKQQSKNLSPFRDQSPKSVMGDNKQPQQHRMTIYKDQIMRANDRLIDSVAKVTELLRANQTLREEVDIQARSLDSKDYELYSIQQENIRLREKIDVLESSVFNQQHSQNSRRQPAGAFAISINDSMEMDSSRDNSQFQTVDFNNPKNIEKVYKELVTLKQNNRFLENRVKTLERQNVEISKSLDFVGNNEPTRPVIGLPGVSQSAFQQNKSSGSNLILGKAKKSVRYSGVIFESENGNISSPTIMSDPNEMPTNRSHHQMDSFRSNSGIQPKPFLYSRPPPILPQRDHSRGNFERGIHKNQKKYLQRLGNEYALLLSDGHMPNNTASQKLMQIRRKTSQSGLQMQEDDFSDAQPIINSMVLAESSVKRSAQQMPHIMMSSLQVNQGNGALQSQRYSQQQLIEVPAMSSRAKKVKKRKTGPAQ